MWKPGYCSNDKAFVSARPAPDAGRAEIKVSVQLAGAGGTMMPEEPIAFSFARAGKWNTVRFNTHTMINAGNYTIKLIFKDAEGLALNGIDIQ